MEKYLTYHYFNRLTKPVLPVLVVLTVALFGMGLYYGLIASPSDYEQGDSVRIMYVHVPTASLSLMIYSIMALSSASYLIWRNNLAQMISIASAPIGMIYAVICLVTGAIWGYEIWNAWWVWDARLTSMLVLFFFYAGYLVLYHSFDHMAQAQMMSSILVVVGMINVPIVKFSVDWWNTLHQPASIFRLDGPTIHSSMLVPLLLMLAAFFCLYLVLMIIRVRTIKLQQRHRRKQMLHIS